MFSFLREHIEKRIHLTDGEFNTITKYFTPKSIKKNQFLLHEGIVCRHIGFVNTGCLREYSIDNKGIEHIIQFAIEDWWVSDLQSFLSGLPATNNIDALQNSEVLLLERSAPEELLNNCPKMERFFRLLIEANQVAARERITDSLEATAEERYLKFIKTYPKLFGQIPQNQIAYYLGITPQSLSRIRKELSNK